MKDAVESAFGFSSATTNLITFVVFVMFLSRRGGKKTHNAEYHDRMKTIPLLAFAAFYFINALVSIDRMLSGQVVVGIAIVSMLFIGFFSALI